MSDFPLTDGRMGPLTHYYRATDLFLKDLEISKRPAVTAAVTCQKIKNKTHLLKTIKPTCAEAGSWSKPFLVVGQLGRKPCVSCVRVQTPHRPAPGKVNSNEAERWKTMTRYKFIPDNRKEPICVCVFCLFFFFHSARLSTPLFSSSLPPHRNSGNRRDVTQVTHLF